MLGSEETCPKMCATEMRKLRWMSDNIVSDRIRSEWMSKKLMLIIPIEDKMRETNDLGIFDGGQ